MTTFNTEKIQRKCARNGGHTYHFRAQYARFTKKGTSTVVKEFVCQECGKKKVMTDAQQYAASKLVFEQRAKRRNAAKKRESK